MLSDLTQVGEKRYIASCNVLAVSNDLLEDFFRDFYFVMKITRAGQVRKYAIAD